MKVIKLKAIASVLLFVSSVAQSDQWNYSRYSPKQGFQWGGGSVQRQNQGQSFNYYQYQPREGIRFGTGSIDNNGNFNSITIGPEGPDFSFGNIQQVPSYDYYDR